MDAHETNDLPAPALSSAGAVWSAPRAFLDYKPSVRERAEHRFAAFRVWYAALRGGATKTEANRMTRREWKRIGGGNVSEKSIYRWAARIDERGGEAAAVVAFCDGKECPHVRARLSVPEEFLAAVRSKALEPGVRFWSAACRYFELRWMRGETVPGLGKRATADAPFPFTTKQLRKFQPSKAAREMAGRSRFHAKVAGLLPALPVGSRNLRLRERIVLDDKRLDIVCLDDETGRPVTLTLYIAMDEGTRQILGYLLREDGAVRQTDVEALTAFILRVCGFAGHAAGYATTLKFERGTVAISPARQRLLEMLFPGQLVIERTKMLGGHNVRGDFAQTPSGNFFGKGKLESFMATLDRYTTHLAGQRGNVYRNTPLMLGDLLTTPEKLAHPNYKAKGTMIEEAVLCGQAAQAIFYGKNGNLPGAAAASAATGVRGPLLFTSELNGAVQTVIAFYNAERGHRREGFEELPVLKENGGMGSVTESSNDKARRLEMAMESQGRRLSRISAADCAALLHKVRRVIVRPNGARVRISGVERLYWHESSLAVAAAQQSSHGEKEYLALFNPEDPRELYLLKNPSGSVPPTAEALPADEKPHFFEALPMYVIAEAGSERDLAEQSTRIAANHGRVLRELGVASLPYVAEQAERRQENIRLMNDIGEPLRAMINVVESGRAFEELPASEFADELEAERGLLEAAARVQKIRERAAAQTAGTRADARAAAAAELAEFQKRHNVARDETPTPEVY